MTVYNYHTAKREVREKALQASEPLDRLIRPRDVQGGAEEWGQIPTEALEREVQECVSVTLAERHAHAALHHAIEEMALIVWRDDMPRLPMDALATDDEREAITVHGVWPNGMDKYRAKQLLTTQDVPLEAIQEAEETAREALADGFEPTKVEL